MANKKETTNSKKLTFEEKLIERDRLQKELLFATEQKVDDQGSNKYLDRELLKIELQNGSTINLIEINKIISHMLRKHEVRFIEPYYIEMFRLNKWRVVDNYRTKPYQAALYTNQIIYGRFSKDVLPTLQVINPYVKYSKRQHKHFQFLTDEGIELLTKYINEAIEVMKLSTDWYDFRKKLHAIHGVPYQSDLFDGK